MSKLLQTLAWLALCVLPFAVQAAPMHIQAIYDLYKGQLKVGEISETFSREQDRYTLSSTTRPVGLLAMFKPEKIFITSSGNITAQGLQPRAFKHQRERDDSRESRAEFDWANKKLTLINHGQRNEFDLPGGAQDRLSAMYQFMFINTDNSKIEFPMTNGSKLDNYRYAIKPNQRIETPAGKFNTRYLDSQAKQGESRTEIWLATEHSNLPCKMTITDANGEQLTQVLSSIQIKP
ncbi:MAG: DUF3108 domain-containing protein [Gallionella sp.]|nr:DUF3108 domain-containing protein [Gallionella sp.]